MLRIEIRKEGERQVDVRELRGLQFSLGRSVNHDVVLMDPRVSREGVRIEMLREGGFVYTDGTKKRTANRELRVEVGPYTIDFEDLRLLDDEHTNPAYMPSLTRLNRAIVGIGFVLAEVLVFFEERYFKPTAAEWPELFATMFLAAVAMLLPVLALSIINRAVNGDYRFWRLARWELVAGFGIIFLQTDMFGLRWVLGPWMRIAEFYNTLVAFWAVFCFARLVAIIFDHLKPWARRGMALVLAVAAIYWQWSPLIPLKDRQRFARVETAALRPAWMDSAPVEEALFLERINSVFESDEGPVETVSK